MKVKLLCIGKTDDANLDELIQVYVKRLGFYINFDIEMLPDLKKTKNLSELQQKNKEGSLILSTLQPQEELWLMDEKGREMSSRSFSKYLQKKMNSGIKSLIFVIGGPYGFSEEVYARASGKISMSKMTFSHQMIRVFAVEQLYRAFTILKNEPYHHD